jgi:3-oxoacyl-[acyl-carrier-protein] synthase-3
VEKYDISIESIDYLLLHQANKMMNDKIRKKVGVEETKVPYSLSEYGNTSSCSIPLTIVSQLREEVALNNKKYLACGFGVGLSWGTAYFETENLFCPPISML